MSKWILILGSIFIFIIFTLFARNFLKTIINVSKIKYLKNGIKSQNILGLVSILLGILSVIFTFNAKLNPWLNETFGDKVMFLIIFFGIIIIFTLYKMNNKDDTILSLQEDLRSETKELWKKYAELHRFYKEQNLLNLLRIYVTSKTEVKSIQRYKYNITTNSKGLTVKIQGDYNYIEELTDINTVSQCYYTFDVNILADLKKAYVSSKKSEKTENLNDDDYEGLIDMYRVLGTNLYSKCKTNLDLQDKMLSKDEVAVTIEEEETVPNIEPETFTDKATISDPQEYIFTEDDISNFQILQLVIKELKNGLNANIPLPPFTDEQLEQLKDRRKTGMDIAVFLLKNHLGIKQQQEIYEYKGNSDSKKNRCYSYVQVENTLGENYVFVIAQRQNQSINKKSRENKAIKNTQDFIELIEKEFYFIK